SISFSSQFVYVRKTAVFRTTDRVVFRSSVACPKFRGFSDNALSLTIEVTRARSQRLISAPFKRNPPSLTLSPRLLQYSLDQLWKNTRDLTQKIFAISPTELVNTLLVPSFLLIVVELHR